MQTRVERRVPSFTAHDGTRAGLVALTALLAACSNLLGIEDLSTEPSNPASAGSGQAGSSGGASGGSAGSGGVPAAGKGGAGTGGKAGAGGSGGGAGAAGSPAGGSAGLGGSAGAGGSAGGGSGTAGAGSGGDAGNGGAPSGKVSGTIIDFWGHPLPSVPVAIGDVKATTDPAGKFSFDDVPGEYDVSFIVSTVDPETVHGWVFQGLTRRDPTLQVIKGFDNFGAHFNVSQKNGGTFDEGPWIYAAACDGGSDAAKVSSIGIDQRPTWQGPKMVTWTLHSLFMEQTGDLPSDYIAYETKTAATDATGLTMQQNFEMNLAQQNISSGKVSGAIVDSSGLGRTNSVFVRFSTGAALAVVDRVPVSANSYEYLVPSLANGSITVAASELNDTDDSFSIAHRDQRVVGDTGVDIEIQPTVSGLKPAGGTMDVDPDTEFSFNAGDPENSGYLVAIEDSFVNRGIFVVTAKRKFTLAELPIVMGQFELTKGEEHNWNVQTHGKFASVDEMTDPSGYLDAFATWSYRPEGVPNGDGAFTESAQLWFETAP